MSDTTANQASAVDDEIAAIAAVGAALQPLDAATRARVLRWALDRYEVLPPAPTRKAATKTDAVGEEEVEQPQFSEFASLYAAIDPKTDPERALAAAYWFCTLQKQESFKSQELNESLNNLGHRVGNITDALDSLMSRKPQLVLQLEKSGKSRQARKTFKISRAGEDYVRTRIRGDSAVESS